MPGRYQRAIGSDGGAQRTPRNPARGSALLGVLLAALAAPWPAAAQAAGGIQGVVSGAAGEAPIPGAEVRVFGGGGQRAMTTTTGDAGRFALVGLPEGVYELEVSALGWRPAAVPHLQVRERTVTRVDVSLDPSPLALSPVLVSPGEPYDGLGAASPAVLNRRRLDDSPTLGQDALRAAARLPGVATSEFLAALHVRGAASDELTVRLDGLELLEPFHLEDLGGMLSLVDERSLRSATLLPGALPARFAGPGIAALDLRSRSAESDGARAEVGASMTAGRAQASGRLGPGAEWLASARVGYLGLVLSMVETGFRADPDLYDAFAKIAWHGRSSDLAVHVLRAGDRLRVEDRGLALRSDRSSAYAWTTWEVRPAASLVGESVVSAGRLDRLRRGGEQGPAAVPDGVGPEGGLTVTDARAVERLAARQRWTLTPWSALSFEVGWRAAWVRGEWDYERLDEPERSPVAARFGASTTDLGAHAAVSLRPVRPLVFDVGARWDRRLPERMARVSPRVSATLGERTRLRVAWGRHWQPQELHELNVEDGERLLHLEQSAEQVVVGLEHDFGKEATLRLEAYHRRTLDPRPYPLNLQPNFELFPEAVGDRLLLAPEAGRARGVELLVEGGVAGPLRWGASWVVSVSEDRIVGTWRPRPWDQRHALTAELSWRPSPAWSATLAGRYHTGWPATAAAVVDSLRVGAIGPRDALGRVNEERLDDYRRMDLRVTRRIGVGGLRLDLFADVLNVLNHTNMRRLAPPGKRGDSEREFMDNFLPRMGSVGLTLRF